jgi:hypothetical protein
MNSAKRDYPKEDRSEDAHWLRLTIQLGAWDQRFLSELAKAEGIPTPAFVGNLIREKLKQAREAARG